MNTPDLSALTLNHVMKQTHVFVQMRYSIVCVLYAIFSGLFGICQTNAEEQDSWCEVPYLLETIPFIAYYPQSFTADRSETSRSYVTHFNAENNLAEGYEYEWCMVLHSPDESLRVRMVCHAEENFIPVDKHYNHGRELFLARFFKDCKDIQVEEAGEYVIIQGTETRESGQKERIIVYLGNADDQGSIEQDSGRSYVFHKIIITENAPGALEKHDKTIQEIVHRFKPCYVVPPADANLGIKAETIQGVYELTPHECAANPRVLVLSSIIDSSEDNTDILKVDAVLIYKGEFFDKGSVEQWSDLIIKDKTILYPDGTVFGKFLSGDYSELWVRGHSTDTDNESTWESYYKKIK